MSKSTNTAFELNGQDRVSIRGIKNGLLFKLADDVQFDEVLTALSAKLNQASSPFSSNGKMTAYVDYGARELTSEMESAVENLFLTVGEIQVKKYEDLEIQVPISKETRRKDPFVYKGTLRSGQVVEHDGDVIVIGNVNPGAHIIASGDIYIFGRLRGYVHAGAEGNMKAIVAAAYFEPVQVRIASVIRRSPEAYQHPAEMEFAHLEGEQMAVEKMSFLQHFQAIALSDRAVI